MARIRIAHFSDTHVLSLKGVQLKSLLNKRITGAVNLALNRAKHYRVEVFEELLDAVVAIQPDHSICTGDLVNLALAPEFEKVQSLLQQRFDATQLTLVPGNHDYYTKEASLAGHFETSFAEYLPHDLDSQSSDTYPVTRLLDDVAIIGLSTAIPTPTFMANGQIGNEQRTRLQNILQTEDVQSRFRLLMLHHPLFREPKRRLEATRRLNDATELIQLVDQEAYAPHLIVHGHNHEYKRQALPNTQCPVLQVASASRAGKKRAEFHVYVIENKKLLAVERHIHDPDRHCFVPHDEAGNIISAA